MAYQLNGPVGRNCISRGGNRPEDRDTARDAFQAIPASRGGSTGLPPQDVGALIAAIETFQRHWWPGTRPDGVMEPEGRTWRKARSLLGASAGGPATPAPSASGGAKSLAIDKRHKFFQAMSEWKDQKLNASRTDTLHAKGCLLTCIASALSWKGVTIPAGEVKRVHDMRRQKGFPTTGVYAANAITPSTLDAWMSLNDGQGYANKNSTDLDSGYISRMLNRRDIAFMGAHSPGRSDWLAMPSAGQMADWLEQEQILIVRRTANQHHFLWITGHDGAGTFTVWDVGYPEGSPHHTATVQASDLDRVLRWARRP